MKKLERDGKQWGYIFSLYIFSEKFLMHDLVYAGVFEIKDVRHILN